MSFIEKKINVDELQKYKKYSNVGHLDHTQHDPSAMKTIHFKQDYIVMIRKKVYYAATAQSKDGTNADENYLRVYQVNNFLNIRTTLNTFGRPGSCSISVRGNERVICADKTSDDDSIPTWENLLKDWKSINRDEIKDRTLKGISEDSFTRYDNEMDERQAKYGWRIAEKCDWEPMDEIWVFGKTINKQLIGPDGEYPFLPIFFGYIDSIQKTYQSGSGGSLVNIQASDHLKLFALSRVLNSPSMMPGKDSGGGLDIRYNQDKYGYFLINDPFKKIREGSSDNVEDFDKYLMENIYSGKEPHSIIKELATDAGIPKKYLENRIEEIKEIPFIDKIRNQVGDFFSGETKNRLEICQEVANKLFMEFFADEEGNIVFKIPSYSLGTNRLIANNMNNIEIQKMIEEGLHDELDYEITRSIADDIISDAEDSQEQESYSDNIFTKRSVYVQEKCRIADWLVENNMPENAADIIYIANNEKGVTKTEIPGKISIDIYDINYNDEVEKAKLITFLSYKNVTKDKSIFEAGFGIDLNADYKIKNYLSAKTDKYIPEIKPEYIISFTLIDSDSEVYNMYEVKMETYDALDTSDPVAVVRRAIPDLNSILQFGLRPHPGVYNTPLVNNIIDAEIFGTMLITRSISKRYSGSLTMIDDPSIKIGDPIRFHLYDEHPYKEKFELGTSYFDRSDEYKAQAIFYVTGIDRSISPSNSSHMTLQLTAGRIMGQQSIYDISLPIYKFFYDEKHMSEAMQNYIDGIGSDELDYKEIVIDGSFNIRKSMSKYYGRAIHHNKIALKAACEAIIKLNSDILGSYIDNPMAISNNDEISKVLTPGMILKLPRDVEIRF